MELYKDEMISSLRKNAAVCIVMMLPAIFISTGPNLQDKQKENVSFQKDIAPLLKSNCQPCHYTEGKVFQKFPFENYFIVKKLGLKLNTRFKEKSQQSMISSWIESGALEK